jgi:hypothetical protein
LPGHKVALAVFAILRIVIFVVARIRRCFQTVESVSSANIAKTPSIRRSPRLAAQVALVRVKKIQEK